MTYDKKGLEDLREDVRNPRVYFEQFKIDVRKNPFAIDDFMSDVERNCYLKPDEVLWYETGFWTVAFNSGSYMGVGLTKLNKLLEERKDTDFAICFSNNVSIAIISSEVADDRKIVLSIYASNDIVPFVEVMEPFRSAVSRYENTTQLASGILLEREIRRFWVAPRRISIRPVAFVMHLEHKNAGMLPIMKNQFLRVKDATIRRLAYLIGTTSGGFLESDFTEKRRFLPHAEIWELATASVVDFSFRRF